MCINIIIVLILLVGIHQYHCVMLCSLLSCLGCSPTVSSCTRPGDAWESSGPGKGSQRWHSRSFLSSNPGQLTRMECLSNVPSVI